MENFRNENKIHEEAAHESNSKIEKFLMERKLENIKKAEIIYRKVLIFSLAFFVGGLLILSYYQGTPINDYIISNWQVIFGVLIMAAGIVYPLASNLVSSSNFRDVDLRQREIKGLSPVAVWPFPTSTRSSENEKEEEEEEEEEEEDEEEKNRIREGIENTYKIREREDDNFFLQEEYKLRDYFDKIEKDQFKNYFEKMSESLQDKALVAEEKASLLLDKGSFYTVGGMVFFVVSIISWQILSWFHGFKIEFIYGIASCSGLFIFIEILSGWYLKQYRHYVDSSTYLLKIKAMFDKFMLAYLSQYSLLDTDVEGKRRANKVLLGMLEKDIRWPNAYMLKTADTNFAIDAVETLSKLSKRIASKRKKAKKAKEVESDKD